MKLFQARIRCANDAIIQLIQGGTTKIDAINTIESTGAKVISIKEISMTAKNSIYRFIDSN